MLSVKQIHTSFKRRDPIDILAVVFVLIFILAGILVSLHRYWQYEVSYIDFGQYDVSIWKISRFKSPIIHHFIQGDINVLGDHVTPSVFLISPLYWLTNRSEMILVVQAIAVGLSGLFLYLIGKHILKNKILSFAILTSYFLFTGLQNAVITEFHELTVMTLPLMVMIWAFVKEKKIPYFISLIIMLGFKEVTFSLGITLGIAFFFLNRKWRKISIITIFISIMWAIICFKLILPYFSSGQYLYSSTLPPTIWGKAYAFIDNPLKQRTLFFSFDSFLFLPFLAPAFWLAILQDYASRFLPQNFVTRWDLGLHYNAQSAVLLAVSSIYGLAFIMKRLKINKLPYIIGGLLIINSFFLYRFVLHGPLALSYNSAFYKHTGDFEFLNKMVQQIPQNAVVMTQNNIATRFTHQETYLPKSDYETIRPDYILFDVREGQNPNNYFGGAEIKPLISRLENDPRYKIIYRKNAQYIFKRVSK